MAKMLMESMQSLYKHQSENEGETYHNEINEIWSQNGASMPRVIPWDHPCRTPGARQRNDPLGAPQRLLRGHPPDAQSTLSDSLGTPGESQSTTITKAALAGPGAVGALAEVPLKL